MTSNPITGAPLPDPALTGALRDLAAALTPGTVISGRILEALGEGMYAVQLRGRTLVAESATPLTKGSVVQVQVDSVGDQIRARLLVDDGGSDPSASRLKALGLSVTPAGQLVLTAFEAIGAPLQPERLQVAVAQVATALDTALASSAPATSGGTPPAPPARLADAFALLARANLPATAPLVSLALRAAQGDLPNSAAALTDLRQVAEDTGATRILTTTGAMASSPDAPSAGTGASAAAGAAGGPGTPAVAVPAGQAVVVAGAPAVPSSPLPPSSPPDLPASPPPSAMTPSAAAPAPPSPVASPASGAPPWPEDPQAPVSAGTPPAAVWPAAPSIAQPMVQAAAALTAGSPDPVVTPGPPPTPRPVPVSAAATMAPDALAWRAVLVDPLPDADRDGAAGVMRALALAGVRVKGSALVDDGPAAGPASVAPDPSAEGRDPLPPSSAVPLMRHLAVLMQAPGGDAKAPSPHQDAAAGPSPVPTPVSEAAVRVAHEQTAQTVFPPHDLADYDRVLGLPLMANGQPVPARVAVASRSAPGGGAATFLRVDAELSRLGPVSIRLSGVEGGAMAITVIAGDAAARDLAATLPDLAEDLHRMGVTAGLRVVGDDGVEHAGAVSHDG